MNMSLRPNISPRRPAGTSTIPTAKANPESTHWIWLGLAPKDLRRVSKATFTVEIWSRPMAKEIINTVRMSLRS